MKNVRLFAVGVAGLVVGLVMTACSAGSTATGGAGAGAAGEGALNVGFVAEPASMDFTTKDGAAIPQVLLDNVYETLVKVDQDGDIQPALASSWEVSPDRLTYTFTLVPDAVFTNGTPFTAKDAVFSINRVKSDAWTVSLKQGMEIVSSAEAVSDTELKVVLSQPSNSWLYRMSTRIGAMMTETGIADLANAPVGTGPYEFSSWKRGDSIVLTANPDYWGAQPHYNRVTLRYYKDATALNNALLTGSINVITTVQAPESLAQFEGDENYQIIEGTTNGEVVLSFNNTRAPMNDIRVRQAVRYAIDHQPMLDTCWAGKGTLIGSMVPPTDPWYEDLTDLYPYDLDKAKALVKETGVGSTTVHLRIPTLPYAVSCGQVIQSQLTQAGFKVELEQVEFPAVWLSTVFTDADYDMSIVAHVEPRDLPALFANPDYYLRYDNPEVQAAVAAADLGTEQEQVEQMQLAARTLSEDAAADFLFLQPNLMVADRDIQGLPKNAIVESFRLADLTQ